MASKPYAHVPLRKNGQLAKLLAAIEIPECDCPLTKLCLAGRPSGPDVCPGKECCSECPAIPDPDNPCPHMRAVKDHPFSVEEWARLLWLNDRKGYADPPSPPARISLSKSARVATYFCRAHQGQALFNAQDKHHDEIEEIGVQAVAGKGDSGVKQVDERATWFPVSADDAAWARVVCEIAKHCQCAIIERIRELMDRCWESGGLKRQERERLRWLLGLHEPPAVMGTTRVVLGQMGLCWEEM